MKENILQKTYKNVFGKKRSDRIFILIATAFPMLQFLIFFVFVNINQVFLAFETIDEYGNISFAGLENFRSFLYSVFNDVNMKMALGNSVIFCFASMTYNFIALILAYFLWKKPPFTGFFQWVALLPSVLSSMVFVLIYRYFIIDFLPETLGITPELFVGKTGMYTILVVGCILSLGGTMIVMAGNLNNISPDLIDYSKLEGVNAFQEFIYVVWPVVYPAVTAYIVINLASFFANSGMLYSFFVNGADPQISTIGYRFFILVATAKTQVNYPSVAAASLLFTITTCLVVFPMRALLEKIGPKED